MIPEPKPTEQEPKTFNVINNGSSVPAWAFLAVSAVVTLALAYQTWRGPSPTPTPGPTPAPVVVIEPTKFGPSDTVVELAGVRLDAEKTRLFCDVVNAGDGQFSVTYQPVGKAKLTRTVTVAGGIVPVPPVDPLKPVIVPVDPNTKVTAAIYVYEKDQGGVPASVMSGLNRLNREKKIIATAFEQDSKDGTGDVPEQYKIPLDEAKKAGLPALVVMADKTFLKTIKAPKTEAEVIEVVQ